MKFAVNELHARSKDRSFSRGRIWCNLASNTTDKNKKVIEVGL